MGLSEGTARRLDENAERRCEKSFGSCAKLVFASFELIRRRLTLTTEATGFQCIGISATVGLKPGGCGR